MSEHTDFDGLSLLVRTYPASAVDAAIASCGRTEQRRRRLSARLMVYFVLAMALFAPAPYLEVMRRLTSGLCRAGLWEDGPLPTKASIFQARERLGAGPLRELFRSCVRPSAGPDTPGSRWRGRPVLLVEEHAVDLPDGSGRARLPLAGLVECGTGVVLDAEWEAPDPVGALLRSVAPGALLVVEGGPFGPEAAAAAAAGGIGVIRRLPSPVVPFQPELRLRDGSFIVSRAGRPWRVIGPDLVTTLLDPVEAPARELLGGYVMAGAAHGTLRAALRGPDPAGAGLISRTPEGIDQELYGRLLVHHAARRSAHGAPAAAREHRAASRAPELACRPVGRPARSSVMTAVVMRTRH
ncbi:hypothetical protein KNE206_05220 [Kitasatospora sp. NE20-6]|uniref:transposase domain-containing protein n=1 Tax=Kitasatospora sp. NE20-6 TaxID=2859066 RepID=UPI0034DBF76D